MPTLIRPSSRPRNPCFSSGPCAKRPGWASAGLDAALVGRSHRSRPGKARLKDVIERSAKLLGLPTDYRLAIVPASDTGALELALWSLLGVRGIDVLAWESFGWGWVSDIKGQLGLEDVRVIEADYGELPDLGRVDPERDIVFTWNGTTSGVRVPDSEWIAENRAGLTICDATSAVFATHLPWHKLDVVTYSWQKVMGGEAAHGVIILGPRAVERLENHNPPWPVPKIFRLTKDGKLTEAIFEGTTINTPSMLCVEDALDGLGWAERIGGLDALVARSEANLASIADWAERTSWVDFLARNPETRSSTSVCLRIIDPWFDELSADAQSEVPSRIEALLDAEGVAYDINGYRDAPPGLRIWAGATVETNDLVTLFPWLDWAYTIAKHELEGLS